MNIVPLPLLRDNYGYALVDSSSQQAVVIDPSEGEPVRAWLASQGLRLRAIWCTHHHHDHVGGVLDLLAAHPDADVIGSRYDVERRRIPGATRAVDEGDELCFATSRFRVLAVPGHTLGALAFYGAGALFTGDTLFLGGCGRLFEGDASIMRASLQRLRELPAATRVYCGHEYTQRNLEFAALVEAHSTALRERLAAVRQRRAGGESTMPGSIGEEMATNPFLRWDAAAVQAFAAARLAREPQSDDEVFAQLRHAKDAW